MAMFPHLEVEKKLQVNDKTRMNGSKSFVSTGAGALTTMTIKAGADGSAISVFSSTVADRFLDWEFSTFNIDIDATNNKIDFDEGGSELTATLTTATYTLATLAAEIKTQMDSAGALTYTVTVSAVDKMTIAATSSFSLFPTTGTNALVSPLPTLGFPVRFGRGDNKFANAATLTGFRIRSLPRAITIELGDGATNTSETVYLNIYSVNGDMLFSNDSDLVLHRSDILEWVRDGRNSFKDYHRRAQDLIIANLDEEGFIDIDGDPFDINNIIDEEEFRQWATFLTLRLIFTDISRAPDDTFSEKAKEFSGLEMRHKNRAVSRIDIDGDGKVDFGEGIKIRTGRAIRV